MSELAKKILEEEWTKYGLNQEAALDEMALRVFEETRERAAKLIQEFDCGKWDDTPKMRSWKETFAKAIRAMPALHKSA